LTEKNKVLIEIVAKSLFYTKNLRLEKFYTKS